MNLTRLFLLLLLAGLALAAPGDDPDDFDHPVRRELNEARVGAGLTRSTVRYDRKAKAWRIVTDPSERARQAEADTLCAAIVSETLLGPLTVEIPAGPREVDAELVDALVVLRFEQHHAGALSIVRARYDALRTAARDKREGR